MATNAVIGALRVELGANTAALDKGLSNARKSLDSFGASMAKAGVAAAAAFTAATVAMGVAIKHAIDDADKLGKMSQKIGIPVEELSALKHAADLSGVSIDNMQKAVGKLSKAMVEATANPASEAAKAFKAIGVSATDADGKIKTSSQVITDIAGKFEGLKDGAGKTAVSMALFGKAGADLIPMLNAGKTGLQEMMEEAAKLGIVIDTQTAKSAEAFNDNLTRLGRAKDGIILKITQGMLPGMESLSNAMVNVAKNGEGLRWFGEKLGSILTWVANQTDLMSMRLQRLGVEWQAVTNAFSQLPFTEAARKAWKDLQDVGRETKGIMDQLRLSHQLAGTAANASFDGVAPTLEKINKSQKDINFGALANKDAFEKFIESQKKSIEATKADAATVGMAAGARERLRIVMQGTEVAAQNEIKLNATRKAQLDAVGLAAEQAHLKMAGATLVDQAAPAWQQYIDKVKNAEAALNAVGATAEQKGLVMTQMAQAAGATWEQQAGNMAGAFKDVATAFGQNNREMAIAAKAFGIAQAVINTYMGATKALALYGPTPIGFAAAAAAIASGLASVATIAATPIPARTGGSFTVPGGVGGKDSFPILAQPGEQVDIWRPGENSNPDPRRGARGQVTAVTLNFADALSREVGAAIIRTVNGAVRDGYRLQVA